MRNYTTTNTAATRAAGRSVAENPDRLPIESFRQGQLCHAGLADYGEAWDALFLAATTAGMDHLDAQQTIGRQFRIARLFPLADVSEVAA